MKSSRWRSGMALSIFAAIAIAAAGCSQSNTGGGTAKQPSAGTKPAAVADAKLLLLVQKIDVKYAPLRSVIPAELPESLRAAIPVQRVTILRNGLRYRPLARRSRIRGRTRQQGQNDWTQDELSELHSFSPTLSRMAMLPPRVGRGERQNPPFGAQRGRVAAHGGPC